MMKKNIAVIGGGYSGEYIVSIAGLEVIKNNIDKDLYNIYDIIINKEKWYYSNNNEEILVDKNDFSLTIKNQKIKFDCIFNVIHGSPGEDGMLQGYFDLLGLKYTSCDLTSSALSFDKYLCNIIVAHFGVNVANSVLINKGENIDVDSIVAKLNLPCFIKPNRSGSSIGTSKVYKKEDIISAVNKALEVDNKALIEEFIQGTEITCGLIRIKDEIIVFPITEVIAKTDFFDYKAKYSEGGSEEITPARINEVQKQKCIENSKKVYQGLNCKGLIRIDYIIKNDELFMLDVNTVPGMSKASIVPKQAETYGIHLKDLYNMVIEETLS